MKLNKITSITDDILSILLIDRTRTGRAKKKVRHIIHANEKENQVEMRLIDAKNSQPRYKKSKEDRKERTRAKAEVFTPSWIVKMQNDELDKNYKDDALDQYIARKWLELTCGEGPYMTNRYDMDTGEIIDIKNRAGFLDKKLAKINSELLENLAEKHAKTKDQNLNIDIDIDSLLEKWFFLAKKAYQSCYGYEYQGDSLIIARKNMFYSFLENYGSFLQNLLELTKQNPASNGQFTPKTEWQAEIATIISYNVFQMDGLTSSLPLLSENEKEWDPQLSLNLFGEINENEELLEGGAKSSYKIVKNNVQVKIMDWETGRTEEFK